MDKEKTIYLVTVFNSDGTEKERLVRSKTRGKALAHVAVINKAGPQNVADVLGAGGKIEETDE